MSIGIKTVFLLDANQTFTSNATLADLTGFSQTVAIGQKVHGRAKLFFSLGATGGIRLQVTTPAGGTIFNALVVYNTVTPAVISGSVAALNTPFTNALAVAGTHFVDIEFTAVMTAVGTLSLQGAQNSSDALTLTFLAGSWLELCVL